MHELAIIDWDYYSIQLLNLKIIMQTSAFLTYALEFILYIKTSLVNY